MTQRSVMKRAHVVELAPRNKILDAAEGLFAKRGFSGVGLSEIAESVGLGKSSLFHHFRSKAQLHAAVVARILDAFDTALTRSLALGGTPAERLDRWIDTLVTLLGSHPAYARLLLRSLFEDDELTGELEEEKRADNALRQIMDNAARLLREGIDNGQFRAVSIPHTLQSLIGLLIYHFASGDFGTEMIGRPLFSATEVRRRQDEIKGLLHHGLIRGAATE